MLELQQRLAIEESEISALDTAIGMPGHRSLYRFAIALANPASAHGVLENGDRSMV